LQVNYDVECKFVRDVLKGDEEYEIEMNLKEQKEEKYPFKDDD
jgi:trafficking protein particle complex subunit 3